MSREVLRDRARLLGWIKTILEYSVAHGGDNALGRVEASCRRALQGKPAPDLGAHLGKQRVKLLLRGVTGEISTDPDPEEPESYAELVVVQDGETLWKVREPMRPAVSGILQSRVFSVVVAVCERALIAAGGAEGDQ